MLKAKSKNQSPQQIFDIVQKTRAKRSVAMVNITVVRLFLKGHAHECGSKETRGRPRKCICKAVTSMNSTRPKAIKNVKGAKQVTWSHLVATSKVPDGAPTTAARAFAREGGAMAEAKLRRSRERPKAPLQARQPGGQPGSQAGSGRHPDRWPAS